jgi:hypothetical protein
MTNEEVVWMAPDGSWGSCYHDSLIVISVEDFTDLDLDRLNEYAEYNDEDAIYALLVEVANRKDNND